MLYFSADLGRAPNVADGLFETYFPRFAVFVFLLQVIWFEMECWWTIFDIIKFEELLLFCILHFLSGT